MSRLLPLDLINAQFSKATIGGYRQEEVDTLVDKAANALEELASENEDLRAQVTRLRADLDSMRQEERLVKDAIISAQRAAEALRADATREATLIIEEARQQARIERNQAQKDAIALQEEADRILGMRKRFINDYRGLLERGMREVDDMDPHSVPAKPNLTDAVVEAPAPVASTPKASKKSQPYPTRLPDVPLVAAPVIVEDEDGEQWVQ